MATICELEEEGRETTVVVTQGGGSMVLEGGELRGESSAEGDCA